MVEADRVLKYAEEKGAAEAELMTESTQFTYVRFELGEPEQTYLGKTTEYALRVVVDGSVGFSYFTGNWEDAVKEAILLAKNREKDEQWKSLASESPVTSLNLYRKSVEAATIEQVISDMKAASEATADERIVASNIECQLGVTNKEIANSCGVLKSEFSSLTVMRVTCRAADSDYGMGHSRRYSLGYDIDFQEMGEEAKKIALSQLGKKKTESGEKKVILTPRVFSALLVNAVLPSFLGNNVSEGRSSLNIGKEVASQELIIAENPLVESPQGRIFDDEGVPSQVTALIGKGSVQNFLYDTYYGETTGSGIRYSRYRGRNLRSPPRPCATSLTVAGESSPLDELISDVRNGLLVVGETNSHASKPQSGLFSIGVTAGFIISKGEIFAPVKGCMVSGLAFEDLLPHAVLLSEEKNLCKSFVYPTYVDTGHLLVDSLRVTA